MCIRDSLWSDVFEVFDRETKRLGYTLGITYAMPQEADIKRAIEDANQEEVAGIILDATEMEKEDFLPFLEIHKPLVIYDNDLDDRYPVSYTHLKSGRRFWTEPIGERASDGERVPGFYYGRCLQSSGGYERDVL